MKIAIVTDAWHPQINGVVTTYLQTIKSLKESGYDVSTITPEQFKTIPCPTYPEISLSLVSPAQVRQALAEAQPHAVHIATEGPLGWLARRACLIDDFPFSTAYHTRFPEYVRLRLPIPLRLSYSVVRTFHNRAARTMVATESLKRELEGKGFSNLRLWSRGVDTSLFRPRPRAAALGMAHRFTYVGRVAPEKNLEAFLDLDLPGEKYVIGDGPARESLQSRYPEATFTGFQQGEALAELVAASSVFVFPSLTDTFGVVQLEAMACGVPVAAFPVNGPRAVIVNGHNGWMDRDLKRAASKCLEINPQQCRSFARLRSWEACTRQFLDNLVLRPAPYPGHTALLKQAA